MNRREMIQAAGAAALLPLLAEAAAGQSSGQNSGQNSGQPGVSGTVYELRVYHTNPGKLSDLEARFRDHTMTIFRRHGMESVAYWTPEDDPLKGNALFYILRHPSREAATANWAAFRADPEWQQVAAASEANGKLVEKTESTFLTLTDFSPKL